MNQSEEHKKAVNTKESREAKSVSSKLRWQDPEYRNKKLGDRNKVVEMITNKLVELHNLGHSFIQIAKIFNSTGQRTLSGRGKWYSSVLADVYRECTAKLNCKIDTQTISDSLIG
jgi:hypothetical protein